MQVFGVQPGYFASAASDTVKLALQLVHVNVPSGIRLRYTNARAKARRT
jgi:hypothetical protein